MVIFSRFLHFIQAKLHDGWECDTTKNGYDSIGWLAQFHLISKPIAQSHTSSSLSSQKGEHRPTSKSNSVNIYTVSHVIRIDRAAFHRECIANAVRHIYVQMKILLCETASHLRRSCHDFKHNWFQMSIYFFLYIHKK